MHRPLALSLVVLAALTARDAHALVPHDHQEAFGIQGDRVLTFAPQTQARLARQPAWLAFTAGEGAGWEARFDEQQRTPLRMWGAPIDLGPTHDAVQVTKGLLDFVDRHPALLGADSSRLRLRSARFSDALDTWYVDLDVLAGGLPIEGGGITARIRGGRLVMLGAETYPTLTLKSTPRMSQDVAVRSARAGGPASWAPHEELGAEQVAVPVVAPDGELVLRPAWRVESRTKDPVGHWETFVDAQSGKVFGVRDQVRHLTGSVSGEHDVRTVDGQTTVSPMPYVQLFDGVGTFQGDALGRFEALGPVTATLRSPYFRVINAAGDGGALLIEEGSGLFDDASSTPAERTTYVFLHEAHAWGERVAPGVVDERLEARVNLDDTCNAYFDGGVNFFRAGRGCNNTGRIADVVFHEWGHGFHYYSLLAGRYDGSLGEGAADVIAFLQTGDHVIAPFFQTNGRGIRDVRNNRTYPDDYSANEAYVHSNGLIFGGSMWDLWKGLEVEKGTAASKRIVEEVLVGMLKGGPTIVTSYEEAVFADDDDGDLSNGTPNRCAIAEAFGLHGLGPLGNGTPFVAYHEPVKSAPADERIPIRVALDAAAPECFPLVPTTATIHYQVDGGAWERRAMAWLGGEARGTLPPLPEGAMVDYWLEILDDEGNVVTSPTGGEINPFTFRIGDDIAIHCDDFEADDGGYTHELLAGRDTEGANDWAWGRPRGAGGDPSEAASGERVWGNDLGGGRFDGMYQGDKHNRLTSAPLDTRGYEGVFLAYQRWLQVEDGAFDKARVLVNGERVWSNWSTVGEGENHHLDDVWATHVVDLGGRADDGSATVSWEISSNGTGNFGGWTIDDVCLMAPATPDNRLNINDLTLSGDGVGTVTLTFTTPKHRPLAEIVVVRKRGSFPGGPRQGQVLFRDEAPELGAEITVTDDDAEDPWFYAVYASDGRDWLSRTRLGLNAAYGSADGPSDPPASTCATLPASAAHAPAWLLLALVGLRRRRT